MKSAFVFNLIWKFANRTVGSLYVYIYIKKNKCIDLWNVIFWIPDR